MWVFFSSPPSKDPMTQATEKKTSSYFFFALCLDFILLILKKVLGSQQLQRCCRYVAYIRRFIRYEKFRRCYITIRAAEPAKSKRVLLFFFLLFLFHNTRIILFILLPRPVMQRVYSTLKLSSACKEINTSNKPTSKLSDNTHPETPPSRSCQSAGPEHPDEHDTFCLLCLLPTNPAMARTDCANANTNSKAGGAQINSLPVLKTSGLSGGRDCRCRRCRRSLLSDF